jgi:hypothetical protein
MKSLSLLAAAAIIVVANLLVLLHALRNRGGATEADLTLTQRELRYFNRSAPDDSGVTLDLSWTDPNDYQFSENGEHAATWLDQKKLQSLGFDCSVNVASPDARSYYRRQRPRRVFLALEYDGPAWRAWLERQKPAIAERRATWQFKDFTDRTVDSSHLVAIDADLNSFRLRGWYPDRGTVLIVPAVVSAILRSVDPAVTPRLVGRIDQIPSSIHVPRPFNDRFRRMSNYPGRPLNKELAYRVHLRYGALLEPWVVGVEFQK